MDETTQTDKGTGTATFTRPRPTGRRRLPPWKVLLHNDDLNDMVDVVMAIQEFTKVTREEAIVRMLEAHSAGVALLLSTHREHAELIAEQFQTKRLTVTIEPDG